MTSSGASCRSGGRSPASGSTVRPRRVPARRFRRRTRRGVPGERARRPSAGTDRWRARAYFGALVLTCLNTTIILVQVRCAPLGPRLRPWRTGVCVHPLPLPSTAGPLLGSALAFAGSHSCSQASRNLHARARLQRALTCAGELCSTQLQHGAQRFVEPCARACMSQCAPCVCAQARAVVHASPAHRSVRDSSPSERASERTRVHAGVVGEERRCDFISDGAQ